MTTGSASLYFFLTCATALTAICHGTTTSPTPSSGDTIPYASLRRDLLSREAVKGKVPPGGGAVPVSVGITFVPVDILDVNDVKQVVSTTVAINLNWTDPALSWDPSPDGPYPNLVMAEFPLDEVWTPRLFVGNGASDDDREPALGKSLVVSSQGMVIIALTMVMDTTCPMDLEKYPFDQQRCTISMFMYSSAPIGCYATDSDLLNDNVTDAILSTSAEWHLTALQATSKPLPTMPGTTVVDFCMTIKRKTTFFVISFITPIVMTSYMNTLVFLVPSADGEKISYLVSIFVSNAVFLSFFTGEMPQGLDETPLVMYLVLGIMGQSGILIVINSLLLRRYHGNQQDHAPGVTTPERKRRPCFGQGGGDEGKPRGARTLPINVVQPEKDVLAIPKTVETQVKKAQATFMADHMYFFLGAVIINTIFVASLLVVITKKQ